MAFVVNVPDVPGVPSVTFAANAGSPLALLTSDALSIFGSVFGFQQWGIYLDGFPVVISDNVLTFEYRQQWSISDYPVEQGAFESYDKVQTPFDVRMRFTAGGSSFNRQLLLDSIAAIAGDLNLYTAVSPEGIYPSCSITHYDYHRSAENGVGLITVDVWMIQIRVSVGQDLSNTQSPTSAAQVNNGTSQPAAATATQSAQLPAIVGPPSNFPGQP